MMQGSFEEKHSPDQDSDLETKDYYKQQLDFMTSKDIDDDDVEEFSFTCGSGADATSPIAAEDAFINGQIKPIFPLFDRNFYDASLPKKPPVKKIFVETNDHGGEDERKAVEVSPEVCKKSNSTGFSKIWRFKDLLGRSNSDGRDAFVFLNDNSHAPVNKMKKGKTASLSAHEVYLRSKAKDGDQKRRSYLPYRPELMGFFTNVNTGLTKNLHPY